MNSLLEALKALNESNEEDILLKIKDEPCYDLTDDEFRIMIKYINELLRSKFLNKQIKLQVGGDEGPRGYYNDGETDCDIVDIYYEDEGIYIKACFYPDEPPEDYRGPIPSNLCGSIIVEPDKLGLPKNYDYTFDQLKKVLNELTLDKLNDLVYKDLSDALH